MKYFVIFLILIGFTGITFAEELTPSHDPYTDDYRLELASQKKIFAEESMGGCSGMVYFDESNYVQGTVIFAIIIGVGFVIGFTYYSKKRKWKLEFLN